MCLVGWCQHFVIAIQVPNKGQSAFPAEDRSAEGDLETRLSYHASPYYLTPPPSLAHPGSSLPLVRSFTHPTYGRNSSAGTPGRLMYRYVRLLCGVSAKHPRCIPMDSGEGGVYRDSNYGVLGQKEGGLPFPLGVNKRPNEGARPLAARPWLVVPRSDELCPPKVQAALDGVLVGIKRATPSLFSEKNSIHSTPAFSFSLLC